MMWYIYILKDGSYIDTEYLHVNYNKKKKKSKSEVKISKKIVHEFDVKQILIIKKYN